MKIQVLFSILSTFIIGLVGVIAIPVLTRLLSPEDLGMFFSLLAIVSVFRIFEGVKPVLIREIGLNSDNVNNHVRSFNIVNNVIIAIISTLATLIMIIMNVSLLSLTLLVLTYFFYSKMSLYWGAIEAKKDVNFISCWRVVGWLFSYSLIVILAYLEVNVELYIIPIMIMYIIQYFIFKFRYKKNHYIASYQGYKVDLRKISADIIENIQVQFSSVILNSADKFIVPYLLGMSSFGYYSVQTELANKSYLVNAAIRRAIYPYVVNGDDNIDVEKYFSLVHVLYLLKLAFVIVIGYYSDGIIRLYAGEQYVEYSKVLAVVLLIYPVNFIGTMSIVHLHKNGDFKMHKKTNFLSMIISLPLFSLITYYMGMIGSAIGLVVIRYVDFALHTLALRLYLNKSLIYCMSRFGFINLLILYLLINGLYTYITVIMFVNLLFELRGISVKSIVMRKL